MSAREALLSRQNEELVKLASAAENGTLLDFKGMLVVVDQAPIQEVDVHESLENTLTILRHKLKQGISVNRHYVPELPCIEAYVSELNQVWTNIIDNAIDAMQGSGELTLRTYARDECVVVEIGDNVPGIPPKIQGGLFRVGTTDEAGKPGPERGIHLTIPPSEQFIA